MNRKVLFAALILCGWIVSGYKILVALPAASVSHYQFGSALSRGLANAGHEVTVISPYKDPNPPPNYTEVYLEHTEKDVTACKFFFHVLHFYNKKKFKNITFPLF